MVRYIDAAFVQCALPRRAANSHKGSFGTLHIRAGSPAYRGAAVLCSAGALRAGAGLVRLFAPESVCAAAAAQLPCCMLHPLAGEANAATLTAGSTAVLAGPGLGAGEATARLVAGLLLAEGTPLVLDADSLNTVAGHLEAGESAQTRRELLAALAARETPVTLTPHPGEMARLAGCTTKDITAKPTAAALAFAGAHSCVVVLKGHETVVATPGGDCYINAATGNAGLAKGGSGDVLAGIIAALTAQGLAPETAAACGVWLHGRAADKLAEACGLYALSPADLPNALGGVFKELER